MPFIDSSDELASEDLPDRQLVLVRPPIPAARVAQLPVRPATVVQIELLCSAQPLNLQAATQVILADLAATIHVLCAAADECGSECLPPSRIGDCIVLLGKSGLQRLFGSVTTRVTREQSAFLEHCRMVACAARTIAHAFPVSDLEDAYLAGLFHDVGALPRVFLPSFDGGRPAPPDVNDPRRKLSLPAFVPSSLDPNAQYDVYSSLLATIVAVAHEAVMFDRKLAAEPH